MEYDIHTTFRSSVTEAEVRAYVNKVFLWMAATLAVAAGSAIYATHDMAMLTWCAGHYWLLLIGALLVMLVMNFAHSRFSAGALGVLLMVFSVLEGLSLGPVLSLFTQESLGVTFAATAGMFGGMAFYGAVTKRNLSGMGRTLMMMLFGLIIAGVANIFWGGSLASLVISAVGVVVFSLFTAYDMQTIIQAGLYCEDEEQRNKGAVLGAVTLYLDFINLFLYLLRFLGESRD